MIAFVKKNEGFWLFVHSPAAMVAAIFAVVILLGAVFAPWIALVNPYDLASFSLFDGLLPPVWLDGANPKYLLGTDDQGRDMISSILYGARLSLVIGLSALTIAAVLGVGLGLAAGYYGGRFDAIVMRIADVQLALPAILTALLIDGIARGVLPAAIQQDLRVAVLTLAIALSLWVNFARTARASTFVQMNKEYVQAAIIMGQHPLRVMFVHILPNILGPLLVIMTVDLGFGDFAGGHLVVPWHRLARGQPQPWDADPYWDAIPVVRRMVDFVDSDDVPCCAGGVNQHPWRFPARPL